MLLLGTGHLSFATTCSRSAPNTRLSRATPRASPELRSSSLETIKYMVASGMGVTVVPQTSVPKDTQPAHQVHPFAKPAPTRRVVLAWRAPFTRYEAIAALRNAIYACELPGVKRLS